MNKNKFLLRIATATALFGVGLSLVINHNIVPTKVEATQYNDDYAPYAYSGNYYNTINFDATGGMNGALRQSLTSLIKPKGFYTYGGGGADHLSGVLQDADEDPTNPNNMVTFYTRDSIPKTAATVNGKVVWNREHVWCQSLSNGNWGETQGGTDILHLRPTYASPNSTRNNHKYGDNQNGTAKRYEGMLYGWLEGDYFEPLDCVKGDAARIIMYVWTTYTGYPGYNALNITNVFRDYDTLLRWHTLDKPDALEGNRNNYAEGSKQKNRNPFVDHPELGWKIFGDMASESVKNSCMAAYPVNGGDPIEPTGISLNKTTATVEVGRSLQLRATLQPTGATGTITWSTSNSNIATVSGNGAVTGVAGGSATITATVGSYSASCTVTVSESVTTNYGTIDNPLNVEDALEVLYDAGSSMTAEKIYVKGIVSSSSYSAQYSNFNYVWLQSDDGEVEQALELYHAQLDSSITDDYSANDSLKGCEVIACGYGKKYNSIYELAPKNNDYPTILSVNSAQGSVLRLNQTEAETNIGGTITLVPTLTPEDPNAQYTWESSDDDIATVNSNGVVTGVAEGAAIITVKISEDVKAECVVTVSGEATLEIATSITADDIVYLTSNAVSMQYDGPSGSGASAYGTAASFGGETPNKNGLALTVCEGSDADTYAFRLGSGDYENKYLAWSSGNSLKVSDSIDDNSSWTVSIDNDGNATIANVADSARVIWWNVSSPRFACYTSKSNGDGYKYTQLWKVVSSTNTPGPNDYLTASSSVKTITATETVSGSGTSTDSITFSTLSLTNGQQYLDPFAGDGFTVTFAGGDNDGKYYSTGSGIRTYGGGTITIASSSTISQIVLTWDGSYKPSSGDVVNVGTYNASTGVWTGSATSVVFTRPSGSGHWRLRSAEVTHASQTITVDDVKLRFGAVIPVDDWTIINDNWEITDYGIMFSTPEALSNRSVATVKAAYNGNENTRTALYTIRKNSGTAPSPTDGNYIFTARLSIEEEDYATTFCAAPFIVAGGEYYFLPEMRYSVRSLALECLTTHDSPLSNAALTVLKGN